MTSKRERVLCALQNKETDKIPMGFWYHFSPDEDKGEETVREHLQFYKDAELDFIKVMCDGYFNYPNPYIQNVKSAKDWYGLTPLGENHPFIRKQVERAKGVVEGVQKECCVFYNVFCPMSLMRFGTSEELLMKHLKEDTEAVKHAFKVIAEDIKTLVRLLITEAGCDGIYYCVQNAEEFRFTAEEYKEIVSPAELEVLQYANSLSENNILHCCGWAGDKNRIEVWKDYPAKVVNWAVYVEQMSLAKGKKFFGGRCVLGGFDNRKTGVLYSGTKEEIEEETKRIIQEVGTKGVMIGADCTLPSNIDIKRLVWVRKALDQLL